MIYIQAFNQFGITGGSNSYLIDLSYKIIPHLSTDLGKIVVLISEKTVGSLIFKLNLSSDVTSIIIKNEMKFPYLKVSLNSLVFDLS